ncbi:MULTISPECIES: MarR family transcriptional regulator [Hyphomicrobiales]|jgi:DNA-binding MarR family transcriptional regulator|uniref:MarR family winged helix-turn-helix transcriptional regulator n=1 Tax=Hyphomicrobiales TaxID=356 RepID=UPI000367F52E|nr:MULTISPECIES: MarR family transcriptional regulator [Phyllobacteriaceae]MCX8569435.1 MarR family transcriptional regulator [Aminobacter sp. MET-1]
MFDRCIYFNTTALARQLDRVWTTAFAPFDLTPPQGFMLRAVLTRPGLLQSELAEELKIARATATRGLDGLEAKGLIVRNKSTEDKRESAITPTDEALEIKDALNAASGAVTERLSTLFGETVFAGFVEQAKAIASKLE